MEASAPRPARPAPVCPPEWPRPEHPEPLRLLQAAEVVCVQGQRLEGEPVRALQRALGGELGAQRMPKCQAGYPLVTLLTPSGERLDLLFCAQYGAAFAHSSDHTLRVRDPAAVDAWLRGEGFDVAPRVYGP